MIEYVGIGALWQTTVNDTAYSLTCPSGLQDGDLLIGLFWTCQDTTCTAHTGWTLVASYRLDDTTTDQSLHVFKRDGLASDSGTTFSSPGALGAGNARKHSYVVAYRGAAPASQQFVADNADFDTGTSTTGTTPSVTNTWGGAHALVSFSWRDDTAGASSIGSYTSGYTEIGEDVTDNPSPSQTISVARSNSAVATGAQTVSATYTAVGTVQNSGAWLGFIRPRVNNPVVIQDAVNRSYYW